MIFIVQLAISEHWLLLVLSLFGGMAASRLNRRSNSNGAKIQSVLKYLVRFGGVLVFYAAWNLLGAFAQDEINPMHIGPIPAVIAGLAWCFGTAIVNIMERRGMAGERL